MQIHKREYWGRDWEDAWTRMGREEESGKERNGRQGIRINVCGWRRDAVVSIAAQDGRGDAL
jgi:hypothetical protein